VRWLIDECVDANLPALLREIGYDIVSVPDLAPRASDTEVIIRANRENRLLLTEDKDFGDLVFRHAHPVPGIILLRIDPSRRALKRPRLLAAIGQFGEGLLGRYTVIEVARFRSRPLRSAGVSSYGLIVGPGQRPACW
jgi:predicted nuclease of predicted toxin-antitoxin system